MPLYEYACSSCGHELEVNQRMSDPALTRCPGSQTEALERIVPRTSCSLKGARWHPDGSGVKTASRGPAGGEPTSAAEGSAAKACRVRRLPGCGGGIMRCRLTQNVATDSQRRR